MFYIVSVFKIVRTKVFGAYMEKKLFFCFILLKIGVASPCYKEECKGTLEVNSMNNFFGKKSMNRGITRTYSDPITCNGRQKANEKQIEKLKENIKITISNKKIYSDRDLDFYIAQFIDKKDLTNEKLSRQNKEFKKKKIDKFCKWYKRQRKSSCLNLEFSSHIFIQSRKVRLAMENSNNCETQNSNDNFKDIKEN